MEESDVPSNAILLAFYGALFGGSTTTALRRSDLTSNTVIRTIPLISKFAAIFVDCVHTRPALGKELCDQMLTVAWKLAIFSLFVWEYFVVPNISKTDK